MITFSMDSTSSSESRIHRKRGLPAKDRKFFPETRALWAFIGSSATVFMSLLERKNRFEKTHRIESRAEDAGVVERDTPVWR
jgi:hypothetical protein